MQVEFVTCYETTGQAIWLKNFIRKLHVIDNIARSLTLLCDNKAIVFFSKNNKSSGASKWIDIKYLIVRDKVKYDTIVI
jgi:hypothetical protein